MTLPNPREKPRCLSKTSKWHRRPYSSLTNMDIDLELDLDLDSDVDGEKDFPRLRAGAGDDNDDTIILDDTEDQRTAPEEKKPLTFHDKLKRSLHYLKLIMLFLIWLLCAILLMTTQVHHQQYRLIVIPNDSGKFYMLPDQNILERIGLEVNGPFMIGDDLNTSDEDEELLGTFLMIRVERVQFNADKSAKAIKNISHLWLLEMEHTDKIKYARVTKKQYVFHIDDSGDKSGDVAISFNTTVGQPIPLKISVDMSPIDRKLGIIFGVLILVGLYAMIIWDIVDRTFTAVISCTAGIAVLAAMGKRPTLATIVGWLDVETLLLLFGMMILVATLAESGIFDYLAVFAYKITKGKVWPLINCLCAFVTVLSAILDNVTMMLLVTPVTIRLCEVLALNPVPILMCMVLFSNVGAALTPVGDPPNVIISLQYYVMEKGVNFGVFVMHMFPGVALACFTTFCHLRFKYRKPSTLQYGDDAEIEELKHEILMWERAAAAALQQDEDQVNEALERKIAKLKELLKTKTSRKRPEVSYETLLNTLESEYPIRNKVLLVKALIAFAFVVLVFVLHSVPHLHHLSLGWTALLGAIMLFILADIQDVEAIMSRVEWATLLFFAALIILMEVMTELGLIEIIGDLCVNLIKKVEPEHRLMLAIVIILWVSAIASAFLDNIPVTTMMIRIVISLAQNQDLRIPLTPMVWALAFGACFGGNGTLIGASANVVCGGVAAQHGYNFGFVSFFLVGFPVVLNTVTVATIYLLIAHVAFEWH